MTREQHWGGAGGGEERNLNTCVSESETSRLYIEIRALNLFNMEDTKQASGEENCSEGWAITPEMQ